ncbi:DUF6134 family protein [Falsiroseomonas selenitidurans]|uniref:Uncharacterized protein n=1 Tax=Falsiroseomonas selenitidurans TaxID=2716335 RepID=A0ABX1EBA6_9PROT|nr:DUF6134 family protein [Falsiroseomonas selenitidurans]NKC34218.1 hypothetical protein [Falsiroseomonas selenitidurans]
MRRRGLLAGGAAMLLAEAAAAAPAGLDFRVLRGGSPVGTHSVRFREAAGLLEALSEVRIEVKLMGFTVFRYHHLTTEGWRGGRLVALTSRLAKNGTTTVCEARAAEAGLVLRGPEGEVRMPAAAAPLTWWRQATLRPGVPLFDPRKGIAVDPELRITPAGGGTRVVLVGGEGADVLYDGAGTWVGFATTGEDGSAVRYDRA